MAYSIPKAKPAGHAAACAIVGTISFAVGAMAHRELGDLGHGRVLPQAQLILAEPVAGQDLALVPAPLQRADLRGNAAR